MKLGMKSATNIPSKDSVMNMHRLVLSVASVALAAVIVTASAIPAEAGWGRYRVSTYYGNASVPVVRDTVVVRAAYLPVVVVPAPVTAYYSAPVVVAPAPVTAYYSAPGMNILSPRRSIRTTYYAPAVQYYAPAPATYYYNGYPSGTVILP